MRMRLFFALLWFTFTVEALAQSPKRLLITHVSVVDVSAGETRRDMSVAISAGRITEIDSSRIVPIPDGAQVVNARGKFLIPGLWDMHVHIFNQISRRPPNTWHFPLLIANGVTSVREMWTRPEDMEQVRGWRRLRSEGSLTAPRLAAVGALVDGPAGAETTNMGSALLGPNDNVVTTPEEARHFVREAKAAGIDFVKTYSSLSREAYLAIADESKKQGIPFAGHVPFAIDAAEASSAGQRSMEHLNQILESSSSRSQKLLQVPGRDWSSKYDKLMLDTFDDRRFKDLISTLAKNHTWQVPTLVRSRVHAFYWDHRIIWNENRFPYIPADELAGWKRLYPDIDRGPPDAEKVIRRRLWQKQLQVVRRMHQAGVPFMTGTDLGNDYIYPGFSLHDELALLVEAGFTPLQALQSATRNPAEFLGLLDSLGTVEKGKVADLVLLNDNPLKDIRNTQKIEAVVVNGRFLDRTELDQLLAKAASEARKN
jgi:imidazolonepropionase-like amidohydrolase